MLGVFCVILMNVISFIKRLKMCHKKGEKPLKLMCSWAHSWQNIISPIQTPGLLFATLDIPPPFEHCIEKTSWRSFKPLGRSEHQGNGEKLWDCAQIDEASKLWTIQTNNMHKWHSVQQSSERAGYEPAGYPMFKSSQDQKQMVISISTLNKLCAKGAKCNLVHPGCTANTAPEMLMGSAEGQLLSKNIHQARSRGLDIGSIVEDGVDVKKSQKLGLEKELCNVHMARCQRRRVHVIKFSLRHRSNLKGWSANFKKKDGQLN